MEDGLVGLDAPPAAADEDHVGEEAVVAVAEELAKDVGALPGDAGEAHHQAGNNKQ